VYQPSHGRFAVPDPATCLVELAAVVPATLVTLAVGGLAASIVPLLFDSADGPHGTLRGHLARANPQWRDVTPGVEALAIFDGPDGYVSPRFYVSSRRSARHVPTWNYATVHAHGALVVRDDPAWLLDVVRRLTDRQEAGLPDGWSVDDAPADYIEAELQGIVGIELRITRLEAKRKHSQNRAGADVDGVIAGLSAGSPREQALAREMRRASGQ
jgi:transcriptional regulator